MEIERILARMLPFWNRLDESQKRYVIDNSHTEEYKRDCIINRTDSGCKGAILLLSGQIRTYIVSEEGREVTLYRLREGDICVMSAPCLLDSIVFDVVIETVDDTSVIVIPSMALHQIMVDNPYVELFLSKMANERFSDVMWTMQQVLFMGADKRVAIFLWDEITKTGSMTINYTHDEVARLIGSAREVVTRMLKYFADEGIVKLGRGKIEVVSKEKLKALL